MKIKTKLRLGIGLLFMMIIVLSMVAAGYVNLLKNDTENILVDNYNSLEYARNMLLSLDQLQSDSVSVKEFESNLHKQQNNITEPGEGEATQKLTDHYASLKITKNSTDLHPRIRNDISDLMKLNMEAIQYKSNVALKTVKSANLWIAISGTLCFLIAFTLFVNLPGNIANPIRELSESIREIAAKNYAERVRFDRKDEFGELAGSFNTMAEKLEEYDNSNLSQILIEKKRIETLINNMHEPVIGLDENKMILFANAEAAKIIGLTATEMLGQSAVELALQNDLIRSLVQSAPVSEVKTAAPSLKIYADNKESYFEKELVDITITPTGEKRQLFIGQVIILKNITPFKELDFAKTNFIATVSHELKTPISSIKMSLQLLENKQTGDINEEQKQLMDSIRDDSNRLLKITSELLNMSQVETGNIQLNIQQSNPERILQYAMGAVKTQADQKQIHLETITLPELPLVKADTEKTAWVLINFLTNAIRYSTEDSKIEVSIKRENDTVRFSVKDEGKGIDSRYRDKIFDRYFQIPGSSKTGTGLGLAISKEFIEAQGGQIGLESEVGMGSTFYFCLAAI
ncbi:ATP-binding protein [Dyadobacter sp. 32]|uniref:HAMP domain-containing sensor histidine kinase n=1 Tax=Dyadobacter sp. 32 TaxID=538966 RepID=UPI0011EF3536